MEVADSLFTMGQPSIHGDSPRRGVSSMLYVYVDDVDQHYQRSNSSTDTTMVPRNLRHLRRPRLATGRAQPEPRRGTKVQVRACYEPAR
jgi:hypothetical protein